METISPPIDRQLLESELTPERFIRKTNKAGNEIYLINANNSPNLMQEIGRLRELSFRTSGGGTGKALDIDKYDVSEVPNEQLIVWDPEEKEITAGYRLVFCRDVLAHEQGTNLMATSHLFNFSEKFKKEILPYTIELGRSFVQPKYQSGKKGIFSLDNVWDGLGAIAVKHPEVKYWFGKVTMYPDYGPEARNSILGFLFHYFPDKEELVTPIFPLYSNDALSEFAKPFKGMTYKEGYTLLNKMVRGQGLNIPPLVNSYMNLTNTMKTFGTSINDEFGNVEETGILVKISDINEAKVERHMKSFQPDFAAKK